MAAEAFGSAQAPEEAASCRGRTGHLGESLVVGQEADPGIWRPACGPVVFQCCHVGTRARPWKAPRANRYGKVILQHQKGHYRTWKSWSSDIHMELGLKYRLLGGVFHNGPVDLDLLFVLSSEGHHPDRINLGKAFEDLLQGIVFDNDTVVQGGDVRRVFLGDPVTGGQEDERWEGPERIHWRVTSLT